ncbi:ABC transporter ATP-binding protein [Dapis sp. BLCC M172]|uniref:ABC transporter ATP-binding protein n=1 Tax=Dapis sp. BLCC M172 TaxID=2975281 RepID=UPI003CF04872
MSNQNPPILTITNLHSYYGDSHILQGINLEIYPEEVVVLVGRHGVGKTTLLLSLMGINPPKQGSILFNNLELLGLSSWKIVNLGLGLVPEGRRVFSDLTVAENLEVASKKDGTNTYSLAQAYTDFPELNNLQFQLARNISGGQQQMLAVARTLIGNPQLLLMDEPTEGLAPVLVQRIQTVIKRLKSLGKTMLITGQNIAFALELADRVYVLDGGKIRWHGKIETLRSDPDLLWQYLVLSSSQPSAFCYLKANC